MKLYFAPVFLAAALAWEFAGWSGGGAYPAIIPDPSTEGCVYLLSDVAGIWKSRTRGDDWQFITTGLQNLNTASLAVDPQNSSRLFIGTKGGVHISEDGGEHWKLLESSRKKISMARPEQVHALLVDPKDPLRIYAGSPSGVVFWTVNGGESWEELGLFAYPLGARGSIASIAFLSDPSRLVAAGASGLMAFDFSRGIWKKINAPEKKIPDMSVVERTIFIAAGKKIAWTRDLGASWNHSVDLPHARARVTRISVCKSEQGYRILAGWQDGWSGGVFLSDDSGRSWRDISLNLTYDFDSNPTRTWKKGFQRPLSVAIDPFNANILYFTDYWGVWRSGDGGASWQEKIRGAANTVGSDLVFSKDGSALWAATMDNGLLRSKDGGKTYQAAAPKAGDFKMQGHVWRVLVQSSGRIVATNSPWNEPASQILISEDGENFKATRSGLPGKYPTGHTVWEKGYPRALAADPVEQHRVYLGIDGNEGGGFFYSEDGGWHWTRSQSQPGSKKIYNALAVDPSNPKRLFWGTVDTHGGIYRSEDRGRSWKKVFSGPHFIFDLAISPTGDIYAACDDRNVLTGSSSGPSVFVSGDHGENWRLLKKFDQAYGSADAIAIDPHNPDRLAVSTVLWNHEAPGRIYFSQDRGKNWEAIDSGLPVGDGAAAMAFSPNGELYISRYAGSVYKTDLIPI